MVDVKLILFNKKDFHETKKKINNLTFFFNNSFSNEEVISNIFKIELIKKRLLRKI